MSEDKPTYDTSSDAPQPYLHWAPVSGRKRHRCEDLLRRARALFLSDERAGDDERVAALILEIDSLVGDSADIAAANSQ